MKELFKLGIMGETVSYPAATAVEKESRWITIRAVDGNELVRPGQDAACSLIKGYRLAAL